MSHIYDHTGHLQKLDHLSKVITLEEIKKKSGSNPWPVIEECVRLWKSTSPTQWKSYLVYLQGIKDSRKVTKGWRGLSRDNEQGGNVSYLLDIPEKVMLLIRCMYDSDELPMNKEFYYELGKRFPTLLVREKI